MSWWKTATGAQSSASAASAAFAGPSASPTSPRNRAVRARWRTPSGVVRRSSAVSCCEKFLVSYRVKSASCCAFAWDVTAAIGPAVPGCPAWRVPSCVGAVASARARAASFSARSARRSSAVLPAARAEVAPRARSMARSRASLRVVASCLSSAATSSMSERMRCGTASPAQMARSRSSSPESSMAGRHSVIMAASGLPLSEMRRVASRRRSVKRGWAVAKMEGSREARSASATMLAGSSSSRWRSVCAEPVAPPSTALTMPRHARSQSESARRWSVVRRR